MKHRSQRGTWKGWLPLYSNMRANSVLETFPPTAVRVCFDVVFPPPNRSSSPPTAALCENVRSTLASAAAAALFALLLSLLLLFFARRSAMAFSAFPLLTASAKASLSAFALATSLAILDSLARLLYACSAESWSHVNPLRYLRFHRSL